MSENKEDTSTKVKIKRNEEKLKFDIADKCDRVVYTLHCFNRLHFYYIDFAVKRAKSFKEVQEILKEIKNANSKKE